MWPFESGGFDIGKIFFKSFQIMENNDLSMFEWKKIRRTLNNDEWWFSIIDIIDLLNISWREARKYWSDLKRKLINEWYTEVSEKIGHFKLLAADGKNRVTDCANTKTCLRIIQSIPSPKAEPLKKWLAQVWYERIQETIDPEKSIDRARVNWLKAWRSEKWITQRMSWQETKNKLTDYWSENWVEKWNEFAILTNIIHSEWSWLSVKEHKKLKTLRSQNLRDHMTEAELISTALAELSTRQIAENMETKWLEENKIPAQKWWKIAKNARKELESKTWKSVISDDNFLKSSEKKSLN